MFFSSSFGIFGVFFSSNFGVSLLLSCDAQAGSTFLKAALAGDANKVVELLKSEEVDINTTNNGKCATTPSTVVSVQQHHQQW